MKLSWEDSPFARKMIGCVLVVGFSLLPVVLIPAFWQAYAPVWGMAALFYLRLMRPEYTTLFMVPIAAFVLDLLQALPLGTALLAALWVYYRARPSAVKQRFASHYVRAARGLAFALLLIYTVMCFYAEVWLPWQPVLSQFAVTIVTYPLLYLLLSRWFGPTKFGG